MSLSPQFLDELRARTILSTLVGKAVRLKRAGNEWQACCPFHQEKTPSFYVNDDKAFYHCFGCGAHGDAMRWLMEHDGLEFMDAVKELAASAGMDVPQNSPQQQHQDNRLADLNDVAAEGAEWFRQQLFGLHGTAARDYLKRRGISEDAVRDFGLGFAPNDRQQLRRALHHLGDSALLEVGLLTRAEEGGEPYDRFRGRIIFPTHDPKGRTIGFGGRIMGDGQPKYLNSPDTPLFDKGRTLFNLHRAGPAARKAGRIVVVEGYLDVIGLAQIGLAEVVASSGTALTEHQIGLLWRVVPAPLLCFDGDTAGQKASAKAAIRALPGLQPGRTLRFVTLPAGMDPDDVARQSGRPAMEKLLDAAESLVDRLWRYEHNAQPLDTPEARAALRQRLVEHARAIQDHDLAREYEQDFRKRVDQLTQRAWENRPRRGERWTPPPVSSPTSPDSIRQKMTAALLRGLARHPDVMRQRWESVACMKVDTEDQRLALELLMNAYFDSKDVEPSAIDELFPSERGWHGFHFSFLKPDTKPPVAAALLNVMLDYRIAGDEGAELEELMKIARDFRPPVPPEEGKLV